MEEGEGKKKAIVETTAARERKLAARGNLVRTLGAAVAALRARRASEDLGG